MTLPSFLTPLDPGDPPVLRPRMSPGESGTSGSNDVCESFQLHALAKPGAWLDQPWDGHVAVKAADRIFAFLGGPGSASLGIKAAPTREEADEWLLRYPDDASVMPALSRVRTHLTGRKRGLSLSARAS
jgi:hypothetical protein